MLYKKIIFFIESKFVSSLSYILLRFACNILNYKFKNNVKFIFYSSQQTAALLQQLTDHVYRN
jgi:hypothetical protein